MPTTSGGPAAAAVPGLEGDGVGQGLAAVDGAGAGAGRARRLQPQKMPTTSGGPAAAAVAGLEGDGVGGLAAVDGAGAGAGRARRLHPQKDQDDECEIAQEVKEHVAEIAGGQVAKQDYKVNGQEGEIAEEHGGQVHFQADEGERQLLEEEGAEGPSQSSKDATTGEAPSAENVDKGKAPATPSPERGDRGKGPVTPKGPVLWLGKGNLNRFMTHVTLTPDEEDDKLIDILQDSGRVSREELLKYNIVPDQILANHTPNTRAEIHNLFRHLHESAVIRRQMLHKRYKGLGQDSSEGSKRLAELRDDIEVAQDGIKKGCGRVLRKTPKYLMSDPILLPK